jgi:hypothetical protein
MNFLKNLFSSKNSEPQTPKEPDIAVLRGDGKFALEVVGESYYQDALESICGPRTGKSVNEKRTAMLILEDNNPKDKNAVRVEIQGKQVGYLSRKVSVLYRQQIKAGGMPKAIGECQAVIKGGWDRGENNKGTYGVWLDIPVEES